MKKSKRITLIHGSVVALQTPENILPWYVEYDIFISLQSCNDIQKTEEIVFTVFGRNPLNV